MSRIFIPLLNPLQFIEVSPTDIPQYTSRHMDDYWHEDRLTQWQQLPMGAYRQPWLTDDVISLQFQNNMGQIQVNIIDCQSTVLQTLLMTQKQQNTFEPTYFIYEANAALTALDDGFYWVVLKCGSSPVKKTLISNALNVSSEQPGTLLFEYTNPTYYGNVIFETGFSPSIRINGFLQLKSPPSKDTLYEDQVLDMVMVQSKPYRLLELIIGTPDGMPDFMIDKFNWILGCTDLKIDGRYYTKNEGAKLEESDPIGNGALKTYRIELREAISRNSKIFDTDVDTNEELTIMLNSTSKGFGDTATDNVVVFVDVE